MNNELVRTLKQAAVACGIIFVNGVTEDSVSTHGVCTEI